MKKVFLSILLFIVFFASYIFVINVQASNSTDDEIFKGFLHNDNIQFDRQYLSDQTNTLSFDALVYETGYYNYHNTGLSVSTDEPMITILTHGYGGSAEHWSNNYEYILESEIESKTYTTSFIYDSQSLIERLRAETNGDVYYAKMQSENSFCLYKIIYPTENTSKSDNDTLLLEYEKDLKNKVVNDEQKLSATELGLLEYSSYTQNIECITDISKHMIIVFQAHSPKRENNYIYEQLDYMIDKIVYDVRCLNNGVLPKINLISHSRGGITNMQYALEHPDLVDSIITLGSPFLGSYLGQSEKILDLVKFSPTSAGIIDIQDESLYEGYMNCWNTHFDLYEDINFHALAGYSSLDFINYMLLNEKHLGEYDLEWLKYVFTAINTVRPLETYALTLADIFGNTDYYEDGINYACELILDEITFDSVGDFLISRYSIEDDLFIHLDSQLAMGYYGVQRYSKDFKMNNCNLDKRSEASVGIVHNLEARDEEFITYILDNLQHSGGTTNVYNVEDKEDGTVILKRIYNLNAENDVLVLPSAVDGKNVTEIGSSVFTGLKLDNVNTVVIPETITKIGDRAFAKCSSISTVQFSENSNLLEIGSGAFEECINLTNINLPNSVTTIKSTAFAGCESLSSIVLPTNLVTFDSSIFSGCTTLNNITISENNSQFTIINSVIYSKNKQRLIYYPSSNTSTTYTVPFEVREILPGAIINNKNLETLNLNNVTTLREFSIYGCDNISTVIGNNVTDVYSSVLLDSEWLKNQGDYVILGTCLVRYKGNDRIIDENDLVGFSTIGGDAFYYRNITSITIPNNITRILPSSFDRTYYLNKIIFLDETEIINDAFKFINADVSIKVPNEHLNNYVNDANLSKYADNIDILSTTVTLVDGNTSVNSFIYGENYNLPDSNTNEITKKWYDQNGNYYPNSGVWNKLDENLVLTAVNDENVLWVDESGNVLFVYNLLPGDSFLFNGRNIYINGVLKCQLAIPNQYYEYKYYVNNYETTAGTFNDSFVEVIVKQELIVYSITIDKYVPTLENPSIIQVTYAEINIQGIDCLSPENEYGYIFVGLYLDAGYKTQLINPITVLSLSDKTLYAKWDYEMFNVLFYYHEENSVPDMIKSVKVIDNVLILPNPGSDAVKDHCHYSYWKLKESNYGNTNRYEFGDEYVVASEDIEFILEWEGDIYEIVYINVNGLIVNPKTYTYGIGVTLPTNLTLANHTFKGWYTDVNFVNKVTSISKYEFGKKILYAKWERNVTNRNIRTGTVTITDDGIWNQHYDVVSISNLLGNSAQQLYDKGYRVINLTLSLTLWEKKDGYQEIYLYAGPSSSYKLFSSTKIDHSGNKNDQTEKNYTINATINISDIISTNAIYICYHADGLGADDWYNKNIIITLTTIQEFTTEHEYHYVSLGSSGHQTTCACGISRVDHHVIRTTDLGQTYVNCICCNYRVNLNTDFVIVQSLANLVTENGSYILPNGIVVLVDEDIEAYMNDQLIFYEKDNIHEIS